MLAYAFGLFFVALLLGILKSPLFLWLAATAAAYVVIAAIVGFFWTLTERIDPFRFLTRR